jgi:hypothetical protein
VAGEESSGAVAGAAPSGAAVAGAAVPGDPAAEPTADRPPRRYVPPSPRRSRVVVPIAVAVAVLAVAGTAIAAVRMAGGTQAAPTPAGATARAGWTGAPNGTAAPNGTGAPDGTGAPNGQPGRSSPPVGTAAAGGPGTADPGAQAAVLDAVLDASAASRAKLNAAIARVEDRTAVEQALGDLRAVGGERQAQLDAVAAADLSALPAGERLRALLADALRCSLAADRSFVRWGQAVQGGGRGGGDYEEAQRLSLLAGDAKARFLTVWNPVAARHQLRERSSAQI